MIGVTSNPEELFLPVDVKVQVAPHAVNHAARESRSGIGDERAVKAFLDDAGIGEILVYNGWLLA